jgi:hypothetical protein
MAYFINVVRIQKQDLKKEYDLDEFDEVKIADGNKHIITELHKEITINGMRIKDSGSVRIELKHQDLILFGRKKSSQMLIYKNDDADSRFEPQNFHDAAERFGFRIPAKISKLNYDFFTKCPIGNLLLFGESLVNFIFQNFTVDRVVLYSVRENGRKWKGVFARAGEGLFKPSRTLMNKVRQEMIPISFDVSSCDSSKSIAEQKVSCAFVFPIIYKNQLIAALYIDTQQEKQKKLTEDDFMIISSFMPAISACIRNIGYAEEELKKNKIYSEKLFNSMLTEQNNLFFHNMVTGKYLSTYKISGGNRYFMFAGFEGQLTSRYTVASFMKYIQEPWDEGQEDLSCKELQSLLSDLPEKFLDDKIEMAYASIDEENEINIAYMNNISAYFIPQVGGVKKLTIPEETGQIGHVNISSGVKGDCLLIVPSELDCSRAVKELEAISSGGRDEQSVNSVVRKNIKSYALFVV